MIVPALVTRGTNDRARVMRITPAGLRGLKCSPNRHDRNRQKSVPVPNSSATRNSSTSGEISQPTPYSQASTPRAITRLAPIVASGTSASQSERYTATRTISSRTTVTAAARSSETCTRFM